MRTTRVLATIGILLFSTQAWAQLVAPFRYNEGPGIKLTDGLVFHPGIALEGRYDSNVFNNDSKVLSAPFMRILGHLHLATLSPQRLTDVDGHVSPEKVRFRLKSAVSFREYFSDNDSVKSQRALEVDAGTALTLLPQGVFSILVSDDFARTVNAPNKETPSNYARDLNTALLNFKIAPGGGRLEFNLAYGLNISYIEDHMLEYANKLYHTLLFQSRWRILPKTALAFEASEDINSYMDPTSGYAQNYSALRNNNSYPLRMYLGLIGLVTPRLSTVLKAGYGNSLHQENQYTPVDDNKSYNMILFHGELGYQFSPFAKVNFGYDHNFQDSMFANYYTDERIFLSYEHAIAAKFLLHLGSDFRYRNYNGYESTVTGDLKQSIFGVDAGFDYQIQDWIYVGLGYTLQLKRNNETATIGNTSGNTPPINQTPNYVSYEFTKHQIFGKVGVSY